MDDKPFIRDKHIVAPAGALDKKPLKNVIRKQNGLLAHEVRCLRRNSENFVNANTVITLPRERERRVLWLTRPNPVRNAAGAWCG